MRAWIARVWLWWLWGTALAIGTESRADPANPGLSADLRSVRPSSEIVVSIADQRLGLFFDHAPVAVYPVSTSKFGVGDDFGSYKTPLGALRIREKIGGELAAGAVIKNHAPTGELVLPDAPGRTPMVSRILCLEGLEARNRNAVDRGIYIHGTVEEARLGVPASWGCVRMSSRGVMELFAMVTVGTPVTITIEPLAAMAAAHARASLEVGGLPPFTLAHFLPVVPARFSDISYSALLEYRMDANPLIFGFSAPPPNQHPGARLALKNRQCNAPATKQTHAYVHN